MTNHDRGLVALSSLYPRHGKYYVVVWDKVAQLSKVKIKYKDPVEAVFFGKENLVVVQSKKVSVYDHEKYALDGKFERPEIAFKFLSRIDDNSNLLTIAKGGTTLINKIGSVEDFCSSGLP